MFRDIDKKTDTWAITHKRCTFYCNLSNNIENTFNLCQKNRDLLFENLYILLINVYNIYRKRLH